MVRAAKVRYVCTLYMKFHNHSKHFQPLTEMNDLVHVGLYIVHDQVFM